MVRFKVPDKSKLAHHDYEEGHGVDRDEARYTKCKESAHMPFLSNPHSQPSLDISPIWTPLINNEGKNSQGRLV
jgi:hypothetical protein